MRTAARAAQRDLRHGGPSALRHGGLAAAGSGREFPVATGVATGPPTPGFSGSVDSRRHKVIFRGSVDYRRLKVAVNERDTKCAQNLGSVDSKGT